MAEEPDSGKRAKLVGEIKGVADVLGAIHPISLSLLISAGSGAGGASWIGGSYTGKKEFFDAVQRAGLARVKESRDREGMLEASLELTAEGKSLLNAIGLYDTVKA